MNNEKKDFSIVIISKDNRELLVKNLASVREILLDHPEVELIVVEATGEEPLAMELIRYVRVPPQDAGFSHQRNLGVQSATAESIIFIDDDIQITPQWLGELTRVMKEDSGALGVLGAVFPQSPGVIGFCEGVLGHPGGGLRLHYQAHDTIMPLSQVSTCNTIIKKAAIEDVGGFDLKNKFGSEDTDISIRITKKFGSNKFRYNPRALVYHKPRNSIRRLIPWYIRRGKADADLFLKHTTHFGYFVRSSVLLKIIPVVLLALFLRSPLVLLVPFFIWYFLKIYRYSFMRNYFNIYGFSRTREIITVLIFPFVKLLADTMFDVGKIARVIAYGILKR